MTLHQTPQRTAAEEALDAAWTERFSELPGNPDVAHQRDIAFDTLKQAGLPTRRVEAWHYTDLRRLLSSVPPHSPTANTRPVQVLMEDCAVAILANGKALQADDNIEDVTFTPLAGLLTAGNHVPAAEMPASDDAVGLINSAFVSDGWAVDIAAGADIDVPLELQNVHAGGQVHARFPVRMGAGSKATIIERQTGHGEALVSSLTSLEMGEGAEVTWVLFQDQPDTVTHLARFAATLGKDAKLTLFIMNAGGKLVRQEVVVKVEGEGADFRMRAVNLLGGAGHTDLTMVLDHKVPATTSSQIIRNVVTGKAKGVFQGRINVNKVAQKTDARMACNTLLLSDDADFSAKPELEIFADDVACGHGATVTEINRAHLFYLMARGIPEAEARGLLVKAFLAEIIEELDNEELVTALEDRLDGWFADHG